MTKTSGTLLLEPGTLWPRTRQRTEHALRRGALQSLPTRSEFLEEGNVRFLVRVLGNLERKEEAWRQQEGQKHDAGNTFNPFLPYDEDLFVADISESHVCLLNKFNVVDYHLLIVTRDFEDQESPLTLKDFEALWACMAELEGLAFYNAGRMAGASQRHRHLQLIPLPLVPGGPRLPIEPLLPQENPPETVITVPGLPFLHTWVSFTRSALESGGQAAATLRACYLALLQHVGLLEQPADEDNLKLGPYNLLATREWMLLVPRACERFESISVNALGFAGALLVKDEGQLQILRERGPMTALCHVTLAAPGCSHP